MASHPAYLGFYVGETLFGVPLNAVREVARADAVRRIPAAGSAVAGLVRVRGEVWCAVDASRLLRTAAPSPLAPSLLMLHSGGHELALMVDAIDDIHVVVPEAIDSREASAPIIGTTRVNEQSMHLLDVAR